MSQEFVNLSQAARMTGMGRGTLQRIIERGELADFRSPANARVRLVRVSDLERLRVPVPRSSEGGTATA